MDDKIVATGLPGEIEAPGVDGGVGCEFPLGGEDVEARTPWAWPQRSDVGAISAPREEEVRPPGADRERAVARGDDNRTSGRRRHERDRPVTGARPGGLGCDTVREGRSHDGTRRIGDDHPLESSDRQLPSDRRRVGRQRQTRPSTPTPSTGADSDSTVVVGNGTESSSGGTEVQAAATNPAISPIALRGRRRRGAPGRRYRCLLRYPEPSGRSAAETARHPGPAFLHGEMGALILWVVPGTDRCRQRNHLATDVDLPRRLVEPGGGDALAVGMLDIPHCAAAVLGR